MSLDAVRRQKDRAAQLLAAGKTSAALEEYQRILKAVPGDVTVRQKVAELLQRAGRNAEAITEFSETVKRYAEAGHFFKATALCRVILTLDPKHDATQKKLAELYASRDNKGAPPPAPAVAKEAPKLDVSSIAPSIAPVVATASTVEIDVEDLVFEAEPPPPPKSELPSIPLFSSLDAEAFIALLKDVMDARVFHAGEAVLKEGEPGDTMYALAQGTVQVMRGGNAVAEMHEGDFFGEMALLTGAPRLATIEAKDDVVLLAFPRDAMEALIAKHPAVKVGLDNFFRERLLANVVRANPLFGALLPAQRWALSMAFTPVPFTAGQVLVEEGATGGAVHLLLRGSCRVFLKSGGVFPDLHEGDVFGEISVVSRLPATASVAAKEAGVVLKVDADTFRKILSSNTDVKTLVLRLASERMTRTAQQALSTSDDWRV
jgi:cAMP-dependent protein kinase regulator